MQNKIVIDKKDNVGVCLTASGEIPSGHKVALRDIKKGEFVVKYGQVIGRATADIKVGEWVHTHNLKSHLDEKASYFYEFCAQEKSSESDTFLGYVRPNGDVGVRNEIFIIPTVGCVNGVVKKIEKKAREYDLGGIDGVYAFTHQFGCSQLGQDHENLKELLTCIALNPNACAVLFVGLGCENNSLDKIKETISPLRKEVEFFSCQEVEDEVQFGLDIVKRFIDENRDKRREEVPFSKLKIGLKCGGSDGYSGITANPLVGKIADKIVSLGGSAVLTEVPEMFGAEQLLMNKCESKEVFDKFEKMIVDFKKHYTDNGFPVYENPSPGNKAGGITTLEEKSLGCVLKAGSTKIVDVLSYGERVKRQGVSVLNAPGNDLIAATALAGSGCQIVLFTTGRGTPFSTFVPTMKIATNDALASFKNNWIDFNAFSMDEKGLYELIKKTASGLYKCKSEDDREIAFYKTGVTL